MPYAAGEHEAIPDKPLYIVKIHLVLNTFVQRLIEVLLLSKLCKLCLNFFHSLKRQSYVKELTFRFN